jgi:hypothetical protein
MLPPRAKWRRLALDGAPVHGRDTAEQTPCSRECARVLTDCQLVSFSFSTRVPNRGFPPAVLLRESCREGGQVKNRTVANLSSWPKAKVEALSRALTGLPPAGLEGMVEIARSLPHGHVVAVLGTIRQLGLGGADRPGGLAAAGPGGRDDQRGGDRRLVEAGHCPGAARRPRPVR